MFYLCPRQQKAQAHNSQHFQTWKILWPAYVTEENIMPTAGTFRASTWVRELCQPRSQGIWVPLLTEAAC